MLVVLEHTGWMDSLVHNWAVLHILMQDLHLADTRVEVLARLWWMGFRTEMDQQMGLLESCTQEQGPRALVRCTRVQQVLVGCMRELLVQEHYMRALVLGGCSLELPVVEGHMKEQPVLVLGVGMCLLLGHLLL